MTDLTKKLPSLDDLKRKNAGYTESTRQFKSKLEALVCQDADIAEIHAMDDKKKRAVSELKDNLDILMEKLKDVETKMKLHKENNCRVISLQHLKNDILTNEENLQKDIKELEAQFKKSTEDFVNQIEIMKSKHVTLQHWSGLEIKTTKDGAVIFVLKQIHPKKPEKTYAVQVKLIENQYTATTTVDIPDLDQLLKDLNSSNNLKRFVSEVRKKFVSQVAQRK